MFNSMNMTDSGTRIRNVKYQTPVPLISEEISTHKTFMDTLGRTCLKLTAMNVIDESRDEDLFVSFFLLIFSFYKTLYADTASLANRLHMTTRSALHPGNRSLSS